MDINRDNYEVYFLDYVEGNLSSAQEEILLRFLKFNPDLLEELQSFSNHTISPDQVDFPNKNLLKKRFPEKPDIVSASDFDMFCIAYLEGDLTDEQRITFEEFLISNPDFEAKVKMYKATYLSDELIPYPFKENLRRRKPKIVVWRVLLPVAAAAAILLMFLIGPADQTKPTELAGTIEPESIEDNSEIVVEEKKPPTDSTPATLKVIRGSKAAVPVSDYKKKEEDDKQKSNENNTNNSRNSEQKSKITGFDLQKNTISEVNPRYDQIIQIAVTPPAIHSSSLSAFKLARYQYQRAAKVIGEDDVLLWNLASNGLKEWNKRTGNNVQLLASMNEEGSISGIQYRSRFLNITTPISREED
jgi:hypothetical protein